MKARSFFLSQAIINMAVNVANVLNIIFMLIALRLPVEAFGEISAILAITFLFSLGQSSARNQLLLIHKETGQLGTSIARTIRTIMPIAALECALLAAGSPIVSTFLHFHSALPFIIVAASALTYAMNGILQGMFATEESSVHHAVSLVMESVYRLPLAFVFLSNGYQSEDAAWIMLLASACTVATNIFILPRGIRKKLKKVKLSHGKNGDIGTALAILASTILVGVALKIDILWSKHVLDASAAGVYGIMNFVASVLFLGSSGISRASLSFIGRNNFRSMVLWSYGIMMAICVTCVVGFYVVGLPLLQWISPQSAQIDAFIQMILFAAATGYCIINFSFQCLSVLHRTIHLTLSAALVLTQGALLFFFGADAVGIAGIQALVMIAFALIDTVFLLQNKKKHAAFHAAPHAHPHIA